jgi:hypothetical protein
MKCFFNIAIFLLMVGTLQLKAQASKKTAKQLREAAILFETDDFLNALIEYKNIIAADKTNEEANLNAMICCIKLDQPVDSLLGYSEVVQNSKLTEALYYQGIVYYKSKSFDIAMDFFSRYLAIASSKRKIGDAEINKHIETCKNAKEAMTHPHRSIIKNIGDPINSVYADFVPLITADESVMYFTSRRAGSSNNVKDAYGNFHEDIYVSYFKEGKWSTPQNIGKPLNTDINDACVALSPDGHRMIVYRTSPDLVTGHLYLSTQNGDGKWSEPQKFGNEINSPFTETSACFSNDTSEVYYSSNRPGGFGGKDIYRIKKLPNGKFGQPYNLGPEINTPFDEDAPFLHPDGVTLYFSSKGFNSIGDYDVFKAVLNTETNTFSKPENLGYPINTINNDIFFVMSGDGKHGYYSSVKEDTKGSSDIYLIDTRFGDEDMVVKHAVVFKDTLVGHAKVTLLDNDNKKITGIFNSSPKTGKFVLVMNPLKSYRLIVEENGFNTVVLDLEPMAYEKEDKELVIKMTRKTVN